MQIGDLVSFSEKTLLFMRACNNKHAITFEDENCVNLSKELSIDEYYLVIHRHKLERGPFDQKTIVKLLSSDGICYEFEENLIVVVPYTQTHQELFDE